MRILLKKSEILVPSSGCVPMYSSSKEEESSDSRKKKEYLQFYSGFSLCKKLCSILPYISKKILCSKLV